MQTIEREVPWVQALPSVKDHLFLGGLKRLFPASELTGVQAIGSRQRAAIGCCASVQPPGSGCSPAEQCGNSSRYHGVCSCQNFLQAAVLLKHMSRGNWKVNVKSVSLM